MTTVCSALEPSVLRFMLLKNSDNKILRSPSKFELISDDHLQEQYSQNFRIDVQKVSLINCRIAYCSLKVPTFQVPDKCFLGVHQIPSSSVQQTRSFHRRSTPRDATVGWDWKSYFRPGLSAQNKQELQKFIRDAAISEKSNSKNAFSYGVLAKSSLNSSALAESSTQKFFRWVKFGNTGLRITGRVILCCVLTYVAYKSAKISSQLTQAEKDSFLGDNRTINPGNFK